MISASFRALEDWFLHQTEKKQLINEKQKAELATLRHQLSPHFLFNTLNNISELMHRDVGVAEEYIANLAQLLRAFLRKNLEEKIDLADEVQFIQNYIALQSIRLSANNQLDFRLSGAVSPFKIEPFILINFIENCFKHGLSEKTTVLRIHITLSGDGIELYTENALNKGAKDTNSGIGLENVKKRLLYCYPGKHELSVINNGQFYRVHLKIRLA